MKIKETNLKFKNLVARTRTSAIIVHHTSGKAFTGNKYVGAGTIHAWHLANGWAGIGYHYVINKDGSVERGRPEKYIGSHCLNHNSYSIGVHLTGDFDLEEPSEKQIKALVELCQDICKRYKITEICGHKDKMATSCPGKNLYKRLKEVREKVLGSYDVLKLGDIGDGVKYLQNQLRRKGYPVNTETDKELDTYGVFGKRTEQAVRNLQAVYGLKVDGIVGKETYRVLG